MSLELGRSRVADGQVAWITVIFMTLFHIGAAVALFFFAWKPFLLAIFLYWVAGSLGVGMCYHRLLTHRGYKCPKWVEYFLTVCATLTLEGGPIFWVAVHRIHHQNADKEGDPHSPREGKWWSHMGWVLMGEPLHHYTRELARYTPDLARDKFHLWMNKWHWVPLTTLGILILAIGGWQYMLWAIFFRVVLGLHATWIVNSVTHVWGSRRFHTRDDSTNNLLVALFSFGEGWHNNHHAHPVSARHGLAWYEFDLNYYGIMFLKMLGLAWDVKAYDLHEHASELAAQPAAPVAGEALTPVMSLSRPDREPAELVSA
jgi:fatty-acid desaturase